jgi:hypothetical protein
MVDGAGVTELDAIALPPTQGQGNRIIGKSGERVYKEGREE